MKSAWKSPIVGAALIILLTVVAYLPVMHGGFIWDDDSWTTGISALLRNVSGLRSMWCQPTALDQYYPLSGTTFWLDYHLWGFWTLPYHVENVLLHAAAAVLFWRLLRWLETSGAWLAAAVFALHPVMVESVGWITERKNVLSLVLYLGALLAYGRFNSFWKEDNGSQVRRWGAYVLALLLCLGALLAKTTTFSLPAVIVLIGWWKRGRVRWREDVLPTLPMFTLAIGLCLTTARLEKTHVGAQGPDFALTFPERWLIAGRAIWFYIGKLVWPANLCFVYPRWHLDAGSWQQWLYPASAGGMLAALWLARHRIGRGPVTAALFFVGTLFPLLGFFNAYGILYSFVWDHWVYLPSLGLIALAAALATRAAVALRAPRGFYGVAAGALVALGTLTWRQGHIYQDSETLWRDNVTRNPNAWLPHYNRGQHFWQMGRVQEAIGEFQEALRIKPDDAAVHDDLGVAFAELGRQQDAIDQYEEALRIKPDDVAARNDLGAAFARLGRQQDAIDQYERALYIKPDYAEAHNNLALALVEAGRAQEAIGHYEQALRVKPRDPETHFNLGLTLWQSGRVREAIGQYEEALRINPDFAEAHLNLGIALSQIGSNQDAMVHFLDALRLRPNSPEVHCNLGRALFQAGKMDDAIDQYGQALRGKPGYVTAHYNLGIALQTLGRTTEAIAHYEQVLKLQPGSTAASNALERLRGGPSARP